VGDGRGGAQTGQVTDILQLIDRLEELAGSGMRVPLSSRIMVEEEEFLAIIDHLRLSIPQEIKQARRIVQERHQIIAEAQAEADKILAVAKERAEYLMNDQGLVNEAKARSEEILRQARDSAKRSMGEIDVYALQMLTQLEHILQQNLEQVQQAREVVAR
jgi:cell division septum initiation protein DivIVA